jgi:hypothetical protein
MPVINKLAVFPAPEGLIIGKNGVYLADEPSKPWFGGILHFWFPADEFDPFFFPEFNTLIDPCGPGAQ